MARDQRRLAAIVSADVAGYSRLMGRDESNTLAALKAHRRELIDPKISEYGGRIVKTTGDGLLLEFPSVVDAVRCAVDVQRGMAERNADVPPDVRIEFRVGLNVGDIIIDGDDIYGDGVNIAARLQVLAEPGGICTSRAVRDQVLDKLSFTFEEVGAQHVKNIDRPVEVYRIRSDLPSLSAALARPARDRARFLRRIASEPRSRWWASGIALVAIGIAASSYFYFQSRTPVAPGNPPTMSVAVMPFKPASASDDDVRRAERITQNLTSATERGLRYGRVVSHGLVAKYEGKPTDPRAAGHDLNVLYLVEGEVGGEKGGDVITARLVGTANGATVWSFRLGAQTSGENTGQADLIAQLANRLRYALYDAEEKRAAHLPVSGANAMELVLRANRIWDQDPSPKGTLAAHRLYEEALRQDPSSVEALLSLFWMAYGQILEDAQADQDRLLKEMDDLSKRALSLDRDDPLAWEARSNALLYQGQWERAIEANGEALQIDPYRNVTVGNQGFLLLLTGRPEEADLVLDRAIALDPRSPAVHIYLQLQCSAHLNLGQYEQAIASCEKALALQENWLKYLFLLGALAQKGDMAKAEAAKAELLRRKPDISIASLKAPRIWGNPLYQQQREAHLYAGLRKVGIPEQ